MFSPRQHQATGLAESASAVCGACNNLFCVRVLRGVACEAVILLLDMRMPSYLHPCRVAADLFMLRSKCYDRLRSCVGTTSAGKPHQQDSDVSAIDVMVMSLTVCSCLQQVL
jgi:hypothetical protein